MQEVTKTLPEQILETSHAFTQTLEMENRVFQGQLSGVVHMTIDALQKLIVLCREANGGSGNQAQVAEKIAELHQKATADLEHAVAHAGKTAAPVLAETSSTADPAKDDLNAVAVQSVGLSYKNAVNAQQQAYITQQAATTMLISTLMSTVTATVGKAESQQAVFQGN